VISGAANFQLGQLSCAYSKCSAAARNRGGDFRSRQSRCSSRFRRAAVTHVLLPTIVTLSKTPAGPQLTSRMSTTRRVVPRPISSSCCCSQSTSAVRASAREVDRTTAAVVVAEDRAPRLLLGRQPMKCRGDIGPSPPSRTCPQKTGAAWSVAWIRMWRARSQEVA